VIYLLEFGLMKKNFKLLLLLPLALLGIAAGYLLMGRTVQVTVNGKSQSVFTRSLTVQGAIRSAGYSLLPEDRVSPPVNSWLSRAAEVSLTRARNVTLRIEPGGQAHTLLSAAANPLEALEVFGITASPYDSVKVNGSPATWDADLTRLGDFTLQYKPAVLVEVLQDNEEYSFQSSAPTLGAALAEQGITLRGGDRVSQPLTLPLEHQVRVEISSGRMVEISVDGEVLSIYTSATTVGEALDSAGITLQDLDYCEPGERKALPADGKIRVVRVREELIFEEKVMPFQLQMVADTTLDLDQRQVLEEGRDGLKATRVRVRYEDGVEVSRSTGEEVVLIAPQARVIHYGARVTDKVIDTPNGPITYYLATNVTVTSYSPCRSGINGCSYRTANGMTVQKGVIGVDRSWYNIFKGYTIYVPGYGVGTVADIGAYPDTTHWIDLGYSDDDWVSWGGVSVTIYFLSPAPPGFLGILP